MIFEEKLKCFDFYLSLRSLHSLHYPGMKVPDKEYLLTAFHFWSLIVQYLLVLVVANEPDLDHFVVMLLD